MRNLIIALLLFSFESQVHANKFLEASDELMYFRKDFMSLSKNFLERSKCNSSYCKDFELEFQSSQDMVNWASQVYTSID